MILNFQKLGRITILSLIISIIWCVPLTMFSKDFTVNAQTVKTKLKPTQELSFSNQVEHFLNSLVKASKEECADIFDKYKEIIASELNLDKLYFVSYQEVENLLNQATNISLDSLTLFTHPRLQNPIGVAIVFNEKLLQQVNKSFDFHGLFNISVPSADDGYAVKMKFLVVGQGKFIVGYNRNAKIKHPDYNFATGNYSYKELFIMDAKKDLNGNPGFFNIKGISNPNEEPQWMKGPLNVDIHSMILTSGPGGQRQISTEYVLFGRHHKLLDPIPIEKLYK